MSQQQVNKADKPIHCIACGKVIGQGYIEAGSIQLKCKCGAKTRIAAETDKKPESRADSRPTIIVHSSLRDNIGIVKSTA